MIPKMAPLAPRAGLGDCRADKKLPVIPATKKVVMYRPDPNIRSQLTPTFWSEAIFVSRWAMPPCRKMGEIRRYNCSPRKIRSESLTPQFVTDGFQTCSAYIATLASISLAVQLVLPGGGSSLEFKLYIRDLLSVIQSFWSRKRGADLRR